MVNTLKLTAAALAASMLLSGTAQAATSLSAGDTVTQTPELVATSATDSTILDFVASGALRLTGVGISASGNTFFRDVSKLLVDFAINSSIVSTKAFNPIVPFGGSSLGIAGFTPPSFDLNDGDTFSLTVREANGTLVRNVGLTATVTAEDAVTAPVPVPAAGVLMLSLMAAGGFVARRRSRKAEAA